MNETQRKIAQIIKNTRDKIITHLYNSARKNALEILDIQAKEFADLFEEEDKRKATYGSTPTLGESMEFDRKQFLKLAGVEE